MPTFRAVMKAHATKNANVFDVTKSVQSTVVVTKTVANCSFLDAVAAPETVEQNNVHAILRPGSVIHKPARTVIVVRY